MSEDLESRWVREHKQRAKDQQDPSRYAEEVEKEFPRNSLVADLGGGMGTNAIYFLKQGHKVIDIDISQYALDQALQRANALDLKLDTRHAIIGQEPIPIDDNSLDIVYSRLALHYFDRPTTINVFKEIYKKIKKGGRVFITLKSPDDEKEMDYLHGNATQISEELFDDKGVVKSRFTAKQLREMLDEAGIESPTVSPYTEDLSGRKDWAKSNNQQLLLNEIRFTKN